VKGAVGASLVILTLLVYCRTFDHPFVELDDRFYVTQNQHVQAGLTAEGVRWAFTTYDCANWHPLTWLSLQLDGTLYGGRNAGGFHVTNVLLHAANTLLLFLILDRMTGLVWRSAVVAALFALHPLHVESVAWVADRKDVLSTLFWMLTLAAYVAYVRRPGVGRYLPVVAALGLGLMAKPMLVTLPFVLLLLDYWPLRRWRHEPAIVPAPAPPKAARRGKPSRRSRETPAAVAPPALPAPVPWQHLVLEKLPLFIPVLTVCVATVLAQRAGQAVMSLERFPLAARLGNALVAYVAYLGQTFWPLHLAAFYPHPGATIPVAELLGAGLLLAIITAGVLGPGRRWPYLAVGWFWYLGTLVPVIGVVQVGTQAMADRYTYVPLVGISLLLVWGVSDLAVAWRVPRFGLAAAAAVLSVCVVLTWTQIGYWAGDRLLWEHALAVTKNNATAHCNLGMYYYDHGQTDVARAELETAAALDPRSAVAAINLGNAYWALGRREEALQQYRRAVELEPGYATARNYIGDALAALGRWEEARAEYERTVALTPGYAKGHASLGNVLVELGRPEEAVEEFQKAVALDPTDAQSHGALGQALLEQGRYDEAEASTRRALDVLPADSPLRPLASWQLQRCRRLQALEQRLPAVLEGKTRPSQAGEWLELAWLCQQPRLGRYAAAARFYATAFAAEPKLAEDPDRPLRYQAARAAVLAGTGRGEDAASLGDKERAALREQALQWLRADLAFWTGPLRSGNDPNRAGAGQALQRWLQAPDLTGVRDPAELTNLPQAEREAWQEVWQKVRAVLAETAP
jgi:protein O-mannosyl-transferase